MIIHIGQDHWCTDKQNWDNTISDICNSTCGYQTCDTDVWRKLIDMCEHDGGVHEQLSAFLEKMFGGP